MTLTREEITGMQPARELDALVAEIVMGLDMVEGQLQQLPRYFLSDYEKTIHRDVPLYSSDISAAWEVVEHFTDKEVTIKRYEGMDSKFRYVCWIVDDFIDIQEIALTAPEAICKVALRAVLKL